MSTLNESLTLVKRLRETNPQLADLSDRDLAQLVYRQTNDARMLPASQSSALGRGIAKTGMFFDDVAQRAETAVAPEGSGFVRQVAGRTLSNLIGSTPEMLGTIAAARLPGVSRLAALTGTAGFSYGRTTAETGSETAGLASAAAVPLGLGGAMIGGRIGRQLAGGEGANTLKRLAGESFGSMLGSAPADVLEIAGASGVQGVRDYFSDPVNAAAYVVTNAGADLAASAAGRAGQLAKEKIRDVKESAPDLEDLIARDDLDKLIALRKKPELELTSFERAQMKDLTDKIAKKQGESLIGRKVVDLEQLATFPEAPATLVGQINLLAAGRKPMVQLPANVDWKKLHIPANKRSMFEVHTGDDGLYYAYNPNLIKPEQIDKSIADNSLGLLLGYGTGAKPLAATTALTLRNAKGIELAAVAVDNNNRAQVEQALNRMKRPSDRIAEEPLENVIQWRAANKDTIKLKSFASELADDQKSGFQQHVMRWLEQSFRPKIKGYKQVGPRFTPDAQGMVGSKGLAQALRKWLPEDVAEFALGNAEMQTLLATDKVKPEAFMDVLSRALPEVEVKALLPGVPANSKAHQVQHVLETAGYDILPAQYSATSETPLRVVDRNGDEVLLPDVSEGPIRDALAYVYANEDQFSYSNDGYGEASSDAATGRYGVEPIRVEEMTNPVDLLVRVPLGADYMSAEQASNLENDAASYAQANKIRDRREQSEKRELFRGPHFGDSDVNVVASIRGYEVGDAFFAFEVQSDWGQALSKARQTVDENKRMGAGEAVRSSRVLREQGHPLAERYQSIGIKQAIIHALESGKTKLVLPDAETAMMIEGHDNSFYRTAEGGSSNGKPSQEAGMRQAYDRTYQDLASKLTRSKPRRVSLGQFTTRGPSDYFKGKSDITGWEYDLTNIAPEVKRLYSLYKLPEQLEFESELENRAVSFRLSPDRFTTEAILRRAVKGETSIEIDSLVKFLENMRAAPRMVNLATMRRGILGETNVESSEVSINKTFAESEMFTLRNAFKLLAHEFSHVSMIELQSTKPEVFEAMREFSNSLGYEGRKTYLDAIKSELKLDKTFDTDYLAGGRFKGDVDESDLSLFEFTAAIAEGLAEQASRGRILPAWLDFLPQPLLKVLENVVKRLSSTFGFAYPSMSPLLDLTADKKLQDFVKQFQTEVMRANDKNTQARHKLQATQKFDFDSFDQTIKSGFDETLAEGQKEFSGGPTLKAFSREWLDSSSIGTVRKATSNFFRDNFFSGLFRAKTQPVTAPIFWALHNMRPNIQNDENGFFANLAPDGNDQMSREAKLRNFTEYYDELTSPKGQSKLLRFSEIIEVNQNRREEVRKKGQEVTEDDLVTFDEMINKYGLSERDARFLEKLVKLPELVAARAMQLNEQTDSIRLAQLFFRTNKDMDMKEALRRAERLSLVSTDAGAKRWEYNTFRDRLENSKRKNVALEDLADLELQVQDLQQQNANYRILMEQEIIKEFGELIDFKENKNFLSNVSELTIRLAAIRAEERFITRDAGYAPMTRRGRFLVRVEADVENFGDENTTEEFRGFNTMKEALDFVNERGVANRAEIIDKEELAKRAFMYSPKKLRELHIKAKNRLAEVIDLMKANIGDVDLNTRAQIEAGFAGVLERFRGLDQELQEVISVRGDKFKERRWMVAGFDRNDFIPNMFEYLNYKTVSAHKAQARALSEYYSEHKEIDADPMLKARLSKETEYVLGNQDEFNSFRKAIYYFYLGGSLRHVVQNAVQIPLNGISQLAAEGAGFGAYKHFAKATGLSVKYATKGTTGDAQLDAMLKEASRRGVLQSLSLEFTQPSDSNLQSVFDSLSNQMTGTQQAGLRIKKEAAKLWANVEEFLMSTSTAAEAANRSTSFIASVLAQRAAGVKDTQVLYTKGAEFTNTVNFIGDKSNRPGYLIKTGGNWTHGPLLVLSSLQSFTFNYISQLYSFYKTGNKKALAIGLTHLAALGGSLGMLGAATAEQLIEELTGESLATLTRKKIVTSLSDLIGGDAADKTADVILYGLPALVGMDASAGIGLGSPLVRYQAGQPLTIESLGAGFGLLGRGYDAFDAARKGSFEQAFRSASPAFLANTLRGFDTLDRGSPLDRNLQPVGDPVGLGGGVSAMLGFSPMETTKARQIKSVEYRQNQRRADEYQRATRAVAEELRLFQSTGDVKHQLRANELLNQYLVAQNGLQDRDSMVNSIAEQLQQSRGYSMDRASLKEQADRASLKEAFPSVKFQPRTRVSDLLTQLEAAQSLGQDDVLLRKLRGLSPAARRALLSDLLEQAGVTPAEASLYLQPRSAARLGVLDQLRE